MMYIRKTFSLDQNSAPCKQLSIQMKLKNKARGKKRNSCFSLKILSLPCRKRNLATAQHIYHLFIFVQISIGVEFHQTHHL